MNDISVEQIRRFRLHTHHLAGWDPAADPLKAAGACGLQNTPPGAWETALHNRLPGWGAARMRRLLDTDKTLLQAWSLRGAPVVFPTAQSGAFLSALVPRPGEAWVYTQGIGLALDRLQMTLNELLGLLCQVMPRLDDLVLTSKTALDQTLADWVRPLLPPGKRPAWDQPSMYGSPDKQTVGGAAVSFLLRPCSLLGLVVFGKRAGASPTFTSYRRWTGQDLQAGPAPEQTLVRKYLHCYGPAAPAGFGDWLGCTPAQARRMWQTAAPEMEPVQVAGKRRWILAEDQPLLADAPAPTRQAHLLGGHDPYLGLADREQILSDKTLQKQIWQTVSNPGAVLWQGAVVGMWKAVKAAQGLDMNITLWGGSKLPKATLQELSEAHAAFRGLALGRVNYLG